MSDWVWRMAFMVFVGAIIGGLTNFLAIIMLFRPYKTYFIGKWQLPFTPGLIPKRKDELATQIGKIVVEHLVTPESLQKKLKGEKFRQETEALVSQKLNSWLDKGLTLEQLLNQLHINEPIAQTNAYINKKIERKYTGLKEQYWTKSINNILPAEWTEELQGKIPDVADHIIQKVTDYFATQEGKEKIKIMIENFLKERGKLWNMVQMFIGNDSLADKFQPEIIKFFNNPSTKTMLVNILESEWDKLQNKPIDAIFTNMKDDQLLLHTKQIVASIFQVEPFFKKTIAELISPYREKLQEEIVPRILEAAGEYLTNRSGEILERFQVEEIVREQIESFSLQRLEELVISIAKKELAMITYLGAILGGAIGLIQGIIVLLT
ncbi:DUF445 domain-containing protein [Lederbergia citrea]|uniref:DUF445 domain-containing protein n=1 Tax=Lederbergia citrea TaxID=2833581 RepID=A0A942Z3C7_9BACI|nr:DUF445 family protein [Lederbergia citrea]MBS4204195.1 DUF445 domain-containing protein [Lederbergia citrea]MBS4221220.1 DUF445 domain-containing protein [Lederbergia citrea]